VTSALDLIVLLKCDIVFWQLTFLDSTWLTLMNFNHFGKAISSAKHACINFLDFGADDAFGSRTGENHIAFAKN